MASTAASPTFSKQYENDANPDVRFHEFIGELFGPSYPGLAIFLSAGKDGAIDCFHADGIVWECKFISATGYAAATARWKEVCKNLKENLLDNAPKSSQYLPWYNTKTIIKRYYFCTSNTLENEARLEELQKLIRNDFCDLARRVGLTHLKDIEVEVWSWDRIGPELQNNPHLRLKWFPDPVPSVFKSLTHWMRNYSKGFRAYLTEAVLPYVALPAAKLTPGQILTEFMAGEMSCAVLTGIGGTGKSRVLAETASLAEQKGWLVYMPGATLTPIDIASLAKLIGNDPVFIGLDYLEKCPQFEQVVDAIQEANDNDKRMYLLATCRQSYWHQIDHLRLLQFSMATLELKDVVRHILGPELQEFARECGNVPVFAAFVRFLSDTKQNLALQELRDTPEFTTWLIDHILKTGNAAKDLRVIDQARLMLMMPASETTLNKLEREVPALAVWRGLLEADGWLLSDISTESDGGILWQTAHDVIADGTLLRALHDEANRQACVVRLLATAHSCDGVSASLQTLDRISRDVTAQGIDWLQAFAASKNQWRNHVDAILATRLLGLTEVMPFLKWYQEDASQLAVSAEVQGSLAAVTRNLFKSHEKLDHDQHTTLAVWLAAAVHAGGYSNFVLTQALRWQPAQFKVAAYQWLTTHEPEYQSHYLLTAWLKVANKLDDVGMGQEVTSAVMEWLSHFARSEGAGFVTVAWLDAKQDPDCVRGAIQHWLSIGRNRTSIAASFVLNSWLRAKQDSCMVKEAVVDWLSVPRNRITPEASYIFSAWLDAKQDSDVVQAAIVEWLAVEQNRIALGSAYVFYSWLHAKQDACIVKAAIVDWLAVPQNCITPEAGFVFCAWLDAKQDGGIVQSAIVEWLAAGQNKIAMGTRYIFNSWLQSKQDLGFLQGAIVGWLEVEQNRIAPEALSLFNTWLHAKQDADVVRIAIIDWLAVRENCLAPMTCFLFAEWLDAKLPPELIQAHLLSWLAHEDNETNLGAGYIFRAWGDRFKGLHDNAIFNSACRWVQTHRDTSDATYCMKYIVSDQRLDQPTAKAILDWLTSFSAHEDAPSRLSRWHYRGQVYFAGEVLIKVYVDVLTHYLLRAQSFGEWEVKTAFSLFFNSLRIANRMEVQDSLKLPLANLFCSALRKLNVSQMEYCKANFPHLIGGVFPSLIRLALLNNEVFDVALANQTRWLEQAFINIGEAGERDALQLHQLAKKYQHAKSGKQ